MSDLNKNEMNVLSAIVEGCFEEYSSSASEVASELNMPINSVKGYISSLTKKGYVTSEGNDVHCLVGNVLIGFGLDNYKSSSDLLLEVLASNLFKA